MTHQEYNQYQRAASCGLMPRDELNPTFLFSMTNRDILIDIISGKLDVVQMARIEMMNRGLDEKTGCWIGWNPKNMADVFGQ
jgi:hypothetical protein